MKNRRRAHKKRSEEDEKMGKKSKGKIYWKHGKYRNCTAPQKKEKEKKISRKLRG